MMSIQIFADTILLSILAGAFGGLIRSIFGWASGKDSGEAFDPKKAVQSVIRSTVGGAVIVFTIIQTEPLTPLVAFFTALTSGATVDLLWHNTNTIIENRK